MHPVSAPPSGKPDQIALPMLSEEEPKASKDPTFWEWIQTSISYLFYSSQPDAVQPAASLAERRIVPLTDAEFTTWEKLRRLGWIPAKVIGGVISLLVGGNYLPIEEGDGDYSGSDSGGDTVEEGGLHFQFLEKSPEETTYWEVVQRFLASTQKVASSLITDPIGFIRDLTVNQNRSWEYRRFRLVCESLKDACLQALIDLPCIYQPSHKFEATTVFGEEIQRALAILVSPYYATAPQQYKSFLYHLRRGLEHLDPDDEETLKTARTLVTGLFSAIHIHPFAEKVTKEVILAGLKELGKSRNIQDLIHAESQMPIADRLRLCYEGVKAAPPKLKGAALRNFIESGKGQFNYNFDPHRQINLPHILYECSVTQTDGSTKTVPNIRMGTPTRQDDGALPNSAHPFIIPEFRFYIETLRLLGKHHLYVNFQKRKPKSISGDESGRCNALEKLNRDFPGTFSLVTLSKDSPFYYQRSVYASCDDAQAFMCAFSQQMFDDPNSGFFFCDSLKTEGFRRKVEDLMTQTHERYFSGKETLSRKKRRDFIEIFYVELVKLLLEETGADSFNASCKDCIDRGAATNALMYWSSLLREGKKHDPAALEALITMIFAPALMVRKREIHQHRLERVISAMQTMEAQGDRKTSAVEILPLQRPDNQDWLITCVNARSFSEYQQAVANHPAFDVPEFLPELVGNLLADRSLHQKYETVTDVENHRRLEIHKGFIDDVERRLVSVDGKFYLEGTPEERALAAYMDLEQSIGRDNLQTLNRIISLGQQHVPNTLFEKAYELFANAYLPVDICPAKEEFDPPANVNIVTEGGRREIHCRVILKLQRSLADPDPDKKEVFHPLFIRASLDIDLDNPDSTSYQLQPLGFIEALEIKESQLSMASVTQDSNEVWGVF